MPRPRLTTDYHGRRVGPHHLVELLEEYLDRGRPNVEEADDIRLVLKELSQLAVPKTDRLRIIDRLRTIDGSRSVLCWDELEEEVHLLLSGIIRRYVHTTRRPGLGPKLKRKLKPATETPSPRAPR